MPVLVPLSRCQTQSHSPKNFVSKSLFGSSISCLWPVATSPLPATSGRSHFLETWLVGGLPGRCRSAGSIPGMERLSLGLETGLQGKLKCKLNSSQIPPETCHAASLKQASCNLLKTSLDHKNSPPRRRPALLKTHSSPVPGALTVAVVGR